jgi:hypothetical protein
MAKLKLDASELEVSGFTTVESQSQTVGTVRGNVLTQFCNGTTACTATYCSGDCTDITSCGHPCP